MTFQISSFKFIKNDLKNKLWLLILAIFFSLLTGPVFFLMTVSSFSYYMKDSLLNTVTEFLKNDLSLSMGAFSCFLAFLLANAGFRFLQRRDMTDLYHSVPISRKKLFSMIYLENLFIFLCPEVLSSIIMCILCGIFLKGAGTDIILKISGLSFLSFIFSENVFLTAVMLSGNIFCSIILSISFGFGMIFLEGVREMLFSSFFTSYLFNANSLSLPLGLSPAAFGFIIPECFPDRFGNTGLSLTGILIISVPLSVILLLLSYRLYMKRKSELSGHGVQNKPVRIYTGLLLSVIFGLLSGLIIYESLGINLPLWGIAASFTAAFITGCLLNTAFGGNINDFLKHKAFNVSLSILTCLIILSAKYDVFSYDSYLPSKEDIECADIFIPSYQNTSGIELDSDGFGLGYSESGKKVFTENDLDTIYDLLSYGVQNKNDTDYTGLYIEITVHRRIGEYSRRYYLNKESREVIRKIIEDPSYQETFYMAETGMIPDPGKLTVTDISGNTGKVIKDEDTIKKILSAYREDFKKHNTLEELSGSIVSSEINLLYPDKENKNTYTIYLQVGENFTKTKDCLKEIYEDSEFEIDDLSPYTFQGTVSIYTNENEEDIVKKYFNGEIDENANLNAHYDLDFTGLNIEDISKYLHYGHLSGYAEGMGKNYVYLGYLIGKKSSYVGVYAEAGTIPEEMLKKIKINRLEDDFSYEY